jgi:hypothetical protein
MLHVRVGVGSDLQNLKHAWHLMKRLLNTVSSFYLGTANNTLEE